MTLQDFLGHTSNLAIIDFLAENTGEEYNQTEISECTDLSRTTIHAKLPELILNKIVEISDEKAKIKKFRLRENEIVNYLIKAALAHSFAMAEEAEPEEEQYNQLYKLIKSEIEEPVDVYSPNNILNMEFSASSPIIYVLGSESTQQLLIVV
ncbi:MAG: hypothetical protein WA130_00440 [Candidatus Methanoperedens sp.]